MWGERLGLIIQDHAQICGSDRRRVLNPNPSVCDFQRGFNLGKWKIFSFFALLLFLFGCVLSPALADDMTVPGKLETQKTLIASIPEKDLVVMGIQSTPAESAYVPGELLVRFNPDTLSTSSAQSDQARMHAAIGAEIITDYTRFGLPGLQLVSITEGTVSDAIRRYEQEPGVLYAEPNYLAEVPEIEDLGDYQSYSVDSIPNDPHFPDLWGLHNTGQSGGTVGVEIDAVRAWDLTTGSSSTIIAVIDTGVDYTHPDLAGNMWVNVNEIPNNGIDDDGNGYIDDYRGWDFFNDDNDPMDDHNHGTHCAGTIAAVGNNSIGVTGVNWEARIMPLKFIGSGGTGQTSSAILAILYANKMGAHVISNSWGGGGYSQALKDAIDASSAVVVCSAGNDNRDTDLTPQYPSSYASENIISVASIDRVNNRSTFSNYGQYSVDLGAPGTSILSTIRNSAYGFGSGTSMAAPHVSGVAGLLFSYYPGISSEVVIDRILHSTDPVPQLEGKTVTGGRVNAFKALISAPPTITGLNPASVLQNSQSTPFPVEITGFGFDTVAASGGVTVDGVQVGSYIVNSPTRITAQFPDSVDTLPGKKPVVVTGTAGSSAPYHFYVRSATNQPGWKFRADILNSGEYDDGEQNPGNNLIWNYTTVSRFVSSPAVADGIVYVGNNDGNVYAIDGDSGSSIWHFKTGSAVWSNPAITNGVVYVGSYDGKVYALDAYSGHEIWSFSTGDLVDSSPAVSNGLVYVGSYNGKVYALDEDTGSQVWSYQTDGEIWSSPAVDDGVVFIGSNDGKVYALNASTGAQLWSYQTGGMILWSSPALEDGRLFIGSDNGRLYCLDVETGTLNWSYQTWGYIDSSPAVSFGIVYIGSGDDRLYALDAETGDLMWEYQTSLDIEASPAVANGIVYVVNDAGVLYALDIHNSALTWSYQTGGPIWSSPAVADGKVYVGSNDGNLYAFGGEPAPYISSLSPSSVFENTHSVPFPVILTGNRFDTVAPTGGVTVDGLQINYTINSTNEILGEFPEWVDNIAGIHPVTVTGSGGSSPQYPFMVYREHYTIQATSGPGGRIIPSGAVMVPYQGDQTFIITPDQNYEIEMVRVDGAWNGPLEEYTFWNVIDNHTIHADFKRIPGSYIINATADPFTIVYPPGVTQYPEGANQTYFTQAKPGSELKEVRVDAIPLPELNASYTFSNIVTDHNISTSGEYLPWQVHVSFTANQTSGAAPLHIKFTDMTAGAPTSWYWQFGDGDVSTEQNPLHLYTVPGTYTVSLRAFNEQTGGYKIWNDAILVR